MKHSDASDDWQARHMTPGFLVPLGVWLAIAVCGYLALALYEGFVLDLPFFPYEKANFTLYYLARSCFALVVSAFIIWVVVRHKTPTNTLDRRGLRLWECVVSAAVMAGALALVCVFLVQPDKFEDLASEDAALEWASAIFALFGSALFAADTLRRFRARDGWANWVGIVIAGSFAFVLFVLGMEEISWMQRVVGFETPAAMAETNWQEEFNLHNFQTYLAETIYYTGAVTLLIVLPLFREAAPEWALFRWVSDFVPGRFVVAASAPIAMFNYGHWNQIPIQVTMMVTVFVLIAYALAAARRRNRIECLLFVFLAASVTAGQAIFLVHGNQLAYVPNTTEFKEFFIALGLACFAVGVFGRRLTPESNSPQSS